MKISELDLTKISRNPSANPIEIFRRYGWKVLGTGIDGVVAEHPDKPYVLKIFVSSSSYKLFVEYAEQNQKNASVPKFGRTVRTLPGSQWCYVQMEKLEKVTEQQLLSTYIPELLAMHVVCEVNHMELNSKIDYALNKTLVKKNANVPNVQTIPLLQIPAVCNRLGLNRPPAGWTKLISDLCLLAKQHNIPRLDLHSHNLMLRGRTLVVTDPFYTP